MRFFSHRGLEAASTMGFTSLPIDGHCFSARWPVPDIDGQKGNHEPQTRETEECKGWLLIVQAKQDERLE